MRVKPFKKATSGTGELAQWLGVLSALPEDRDLDASTYVVVHNSLSLASGALITTFGLYRP